MLLLPLLLLPVEGGVVPLERQTATCKRWMHCPWLFGTPPPNAPATTLTVHMVLCPTVCSHACPAR